MDPWKTDLEEILHQIPGYNPWDQKGDCWLDHDAALCHINWFPENLKHIEGSHRGDPFILKVWEAAIVGNLFGWKRMNDSGLAVRRYRKCLIFVARGNGKTPLSAGITLCAIENDNEPGAQNYLGAGQREQAGYLYRNLSGFIDQSPALTAKYTLYRGDAHRSIVSNKDKLTFCKVIPAEAAGQHGGIPHVSAIDELHVHESRALVDVFETAMAKKARTQPLLVMITTSDYDRESICNEVYAYASSVRDNGGDPLKPGFDSEFLPVIYELKPDQDYTDEKLWHLANPNLDVSVDRESLRKVVKKSQESPAFANEVKRLHFNMRTGQAVALIAMDQWDKCAGTIEKESLVGRMCYGAFDLGSIDDLSSLGLIFPMEDDVWAVLSYSWCPASKLAWRVTRRIPYDTWANQGFITVTDANTPPPHQINYKVIADEFDSLAAIYNIKQIGYDPGHGATQFMQNITEKYGEDFAVPITQSFRWMSAPTKEIIRRMRTGKIAHFGNPVLRWATSNVAPHIDGKIPEGGKLDDYLDKVPIMPSKRKSTDKIDPFAALVIAAAVAGLHPSEGGQSKYENEVMDAV